jgi:DUF2075 family protein
MIIYESTKSEFIASVSDKSITHKIYDLFRERIGRTRESEISSWSDSMAEMGKVIDTPTIPDDSSIAIEFNIPMTSNRVDFLISGFDDKDKGRVIIIELKRWQEAKRVEGKDGIVLTALGRGLHETTHPSYQAWSYYHLLNDYNETIRDENVTIQPCAFLHNLKRENSADILHSQYKKYLDGAPLYLKDDYDLLRKFIEASIKKGDKKVILFKLDDGKIKLSKSLQDVLVRMLNKSPEFTLIDTQKVVYEKALELAKKSKKDGKKRVLIVEGGPGTGKSVISINLLVNLNQVKGSAVYVSKNAAPRNVYSKKLKGKYKQDYISKLFQGSGAFRNCQRDIFDSIIVDEAHRLNEKSGMYKNLGENQIKEIINAAKFTIFFVDEDQQIDIADIGSKEEILKWAKDINAEVHSDILISQFRCNGSEGYLAWLDQLLEIRETANYVVPNLGYDFKVFDDPNELMNEIHKKNEISNHSRVVAGYCWNWITSGKNKSDVYDINLSNYNFHKSWNLANTQTWAIDPLSIEEVGCIHTCQGLEFEYVGVIFGLDIRFEKGRIITDYIKRARTDNSLKGIKKLASVDPIKAQRIADKIIRNTYRTLMTRGQKGCYIFCEDKALANYIKDKLNKSTNVKKFRN